MPTHSPKTLTVTAQHRRAWLNQLKTVTALPTAAGCEESVIGFVDQWLAKRPMLECKIDGFGNRMIKRAGTRGRSPVFLTAHMDHPAFVVHAEDQDETNDGHTLSARFMGGVAPSYFVGTPVRLWRLKKDGSGYRRGPVGEVIQHEPGQDDRWWPRCQVRFDQHVRLTGIKTIMTWELGKPEVIDGIFHTPVCDDLAGLVAALCAMDWALELDPKCDVRLLLTRAEEVGLLGAIAAAKAGIVSKQAKLICLETSKTLPHAPIAGGPIVRVGDRTGTFDRGLTMAVSKIAEQLAAADSRFIYQRKLMDGGSCEATAFCAMGYQATCCCLPLGQYHNMCEQTGQIARESIAISDFEGLVRLLTAVVLKKADPANAVTLPSVQLPSQQIPSLDTRLLKLLEQRSKTVCP